jgi:hypothetical protein
MNLIDLDALANSNPERGSDAERLKALRQIGEALTGFQAFLKDMVRHDRTR